jgi:hypothetical protein
MVSRMVIRMVSRMVIRMVIARGGWGGGTPYDYHMVQINHMERGVTTGSKIMFSLSSVILFNI